MSTTASQPAPAQPAQAQPAQAQPAPAQAQNASANPFLPGQPPFPIEYLVRSFGPTDRASPRRNGK